MDKVDVIYQLEVQKLSDVQPILVSAILDDAGVEAIEEVNDSIFIYHNEESFIRDKQDLLYSTFEWLDKDQIKISTIPNENWNKKWESSFEPIIVDDFCTIKASFHDIAIETPYVITINPELAFGTGHHETTYQMMAVMKDLSFHEMKVLDYGCGTGILAILAQLLGAKKIDGIDYDAQAIDCAADCLQLNGVSDVSLYTGELDKLKHKEYDIILANINRKVLLESADVLYDMQPHAGILLLSGILHSDFDLIKDTYTAAGYMITNRRQKGDWLCLKLMKM